MISQKKFMPAKPDLNEEQLQKTKQKKLLFFISKAELPSIPQDHRIFQIQNSVRDLVRFWLLGIFPPAIHMDIKMNLEQKIMVGPDNSCRQKRKQILHQLKENKLKKIQQIDLTNNRRLYLEKLYDCKIFEKDQIIRAAHDMSKIYESKEVQPIVQIVKKSRFFYLISLNEIFDEEFTEYISGLTAQSPEPTRSMIKEAEKSYDQLKKKCMMKHQSFSGSKMKPTKNKRKQEQSEESSDSNSGTNSQEENFIKVIKKQEKPQSFVKNSKIKVQAPIKRVQQKQKLISKNRTKNSKKQQNQKKKQQRGEPILQKTFPSGVFNVNNFEQWIKHNKLLKLDDFQYNQDDDQKVFHISMYGVKLQQKKIRSVQIYFQYVRIIVINKTINSNIKRISNKFCCKQNTKQIPLEGQIIRGFSNKNWNEHALRGKIIANNLEQSEINSTPIVMLKLSGLKSLVDETYDQANSFIKDLPQTDQIQKLTVDLGKLKHYITDKRAKNFVENQFRKMVQQFQYIQLKEMKLEKDEVIEIKIKIQNTELEEYNLHTKGKIQDFFHSAHLIEELDLLQEDITKSLQEHFLIFPSIQDNGTFILIENTENFRKTFKGVMFQINQQNKHKKKQLRAAKSTILPIKNKCREHIKNHGIKDDSVTIHFTDSSIIISGPIKDVQPLFQLFGDLIREANQSQRERIIYLTQKQAKVLGKSSNIYRKYIEDKYKMSFDFEISKEYGNVITLNSQNTVDLDSQLVIYEIPTKELNHQIPKGAHIYFRSYENFDGIHHKVLDSFKMKIKSANKKFIFTQKNEGYFFLYTQGFDKKTELSEFFDYCSSNNVNTNTYGFFMPKRSKQKNEFILQIIKQFQVKLKKQGNRKYKVYLFEGQGKNRGKLSLQSKKQTQIITKKKIKYFVKDGQQKYYYSDLGNNKINQKKQSSIFTFQSKVHLFGQDINHTAQSHVCLLSQKKIVHSLTGKQTPIEIHNDRITFILQGVQFQFPESQYVKSKKYAINKAFNVSLGVYEIDIVNNKQKNMFSGYDRTLHSEEAQQTMVLQSNMNVSYNHKGGEIRITYDKKRQNQIPQIVEYFIEQIKQSKHCYKKKLNEKLKIEIIKNIEKQAQQDELTVTVTDHEIILQGYDKSVLKNFEKILPTLINPPLEINYPKCWEQQSQDIQIFAVSKESEEYKEMNQKFGIAKIQQLFRIQNRIIYRRYIQEKENLKKLNEVEDIKELMLYHGTRETTDPKVIYEDKQQCFNVNYSGENNYLGRGTYFAVEPKYSHSYSFNYPEKIGQRPIYGMLYCTVLIGQSQQIPSVTTETRAMRDTTIKGNGKDIKYESATTFTNNSTIYAVYRSKRAYPSYLIKY